MEIIYKTLIKHEVAYPTASDNFIRLQLFYKKGRGYYASIRLVEIKHSCGCQIESYSMFDNGWSQLILEVSRKSKSSSDKAIELLKAIQPEMIKKLTAKLNVKKTKSVTVNGQEVTIPPCFQELSPEEIEGMPVEVIALGKFGCLERTVYPSLEQATRSIKTWWSAMRGEIEGKDALRFESTEAYEILSA